MSERTKRAVWLLITGIAVVAASHVAVELFPTRWGDPNIGGGIVTLLGYAAIVVGLLRLAAARNRPG